MKNPQKALMAIERLVGGDFGMDMEFYIHDDRIKRKNKRLLQVAKLITEIYMIAHAEGHCNGHPEWQDKKYEILKQPEL